MERVQHEPGPLETALGQARQIFNDAIAKQADPDKVARLELAAGILHQSNIQNCS